MSDRAKRGSSRAPEIARSAGNRSSQTRGESPGAVSFGYFSLGKQRKVPRVRSAERVQNLFCAVRRIKNPESGPAKTDTMESQVTGSLAFSSPLLKCDARV